MKTIEIDVPHSDCPFCPRLVSFRETNRTKFPDFHNAPVASFGGAGAGLLVVGLAPGLKGANRTGRPFTGDYAGDLLYPTLIRYGFARGTFGASPDDGLEPVNCRVTNAVRCVPPENKPTTAEIRACGPFLEREITAMPNLTALLALGGIAHNAILSAHGVKKAAYKFAHGAVHHLENGLVLFDSYHCSRYNVNTRRLTEAMFHDVFDLIQAHFGNAPVPREKQSTPVK